MGYGAGIQPGFGAGRGVGFGAGRPGFGAGTPGFGAGYVATTATPLTILGAALKSWVDFSTISGLWQLSNGTTAVAVTTDPIGRATDKSTNTNHFIQATAGSRPLWTENVKNGLGCARFADASGKVLTLTLTQAQPLTVFAVVDPNTATYVYSGEATTGNYVKLAAVYAGTERAITSLGNAPIVLTMIWSGASSLVRVNGSNNAITGSDPGAGGFTDFKLASFRDGTTTYDCDFFEFAIMDGAATAGQYAAMESYLNTKWAIY